MFHPNAMIGHLARVFLTAGAFFFVSSMNWFNLWNAWKIQKTERDSFPPSEEKQTKRWNIFELKSWPYCEKTNKIGALDCKSEKSSKKKKTKNSQSLKTFSQFDNEWILPVMVNLVDPERVSISVNKFSIRVCTWLMTCVHFSFWPHFFLFFFSFFYLEKMNGMFVVCVCLWN